MINNLSNLAQTLFAGGGSGMYYYLILVFLSFMGGLIASISPCSLAMLPIIIGYVGGYSKENPFKTTLQLIFFIFGTSIVFAIIGIICAITGKVFVSFAGGYFSIVLASLILVMGLKILGILDFELPVLIKEIPQSSGTNIFFYPILLGAVFALAGTPCSTPILAGIMAFASLSAKVWLAVLLLFAFSLGQGLILVIAGVFTSSVKNMRGFANVSEILLKISGGLLVIASIYIFYKIFSPLL